MTDEEQPKSAQERKRPGEVFCIQFGTEVTGDGTEVAKDGRLDFVSRDANTLDEALGHAREAIATHPEFEWDCLIIWNGLTSKDLRELTEGAP